MICADDDSPSGAALIVDGTSGCDGWHGVPGAVFKDKSSQDKSSQKLPRRARV